MCCVLNVSKLLKQTCDLCLGFASWKTSFSAKLSLCVFSVYATTAANPHESSYACYYDEKRDTYLGDWYSVNWMEDSDVVGVLFQSQWSSDTLYANKHVKKWINVYF